MPPGTKAQDVSARSARGCRRVRSPRRTCQRERAPPAPSRWPTCSEHTTPSTTLTRSHQISFLSRLLRQSSSPNPGDQRLRLGAFGKHPGWNDHIDDPGLDTEPLVNFKTLVYVEGVAAAIESGAWDKLDPGSRLDGFSHVLLMRTRGHLLLCRMWSSQDGKGRARYPLAAVVQVRGVPIAWALETILPELACVQSRVQQATTAPQVAAILESARASLRAKADAAANETELLIPADAIRTMADAPAMGPNRLGMHRVMYQMHRELTDFEIDCAAPKPPPRASRIEHLPSVHLRLPADLGRAATAVGGAELRPPGPGDACNNDAPGATQDMLDTLRLLLARQDPGLPMLVIARVGSGGGPGAGFVDAILGEPQGAQLRCLQADEKAIPLTTSVPYTIDPAFVSRANEWIDGFAARGDRRIASSEGAKRKLGLGRFMSIALASAALCIGAARTPAQPPTPPLSGDQVQPAQEPRLRFNDALTSLHFVLIDPRTGDAQAAEATRKFIDDVRELPGGVAYLGQVRELLTSMEAILDNKAGAPAPANEVVTFGPGTLGVYTQHSDGTIIRFKPALDAAMPELAFARVELPDGHVTYIQTTETSFRQFVDIVTRRSAATDFPKLFKPFERVSDPRRGPRVWEWVDPKGGGTLRVAKDWLARMSVGAPNNYPADGVPPPLSENLPMQYLSPTAALYAARLAGCRLLTSAEWRAARDRYAADIQPKDCNLRDQAWRRQLEHVNAIVASGNKAQPPSAGTFVPAGTSPDTAPDASNDWNDGSLWFTPVSAGPDQAVRNLVGNVAEFVVDDSSPLPIAKIKEVSDYLQAHAAAVRVIGGSALSSPALDPATPEPVDLAEAEEGYADVGFRLAFSAGTRQSRTLTARLSALLDPLPVLPAQPGAPAVAPRH